MKVRMEKAKKATDNDASGNAVAALSRRYHAVLLRYFARRGFPPHDAQDLAQEVFTRLSPSEVLDSVESVEGFLFATAANVAVDHGRRRKVRTDTARAFEDAAEPQDEFAPDRLLEGREELAAIVAALNEMPERMRNIFILFRLENLPRAEIAERLGISKSLIDQQVALATACLADRRRRLQ